MAHNVMDMRLLVGSKTWELKNHLEKFRKQDSKGLTIDLHKNQLTKGCHTALL